MIVHIPSHWQGRVRTLVRLAEVEVWRCKKNTSLVHIQYLIYVRGVDVVDWFRGTYSCQIRSHMWWRGTLNMSIINFSIIHKDAMRKGGQNDKALSHLHLQVRMAKTLTSSWKSHAVPKFVYKPMMGHILHVTVHTRWRRPCTYCRWRINWQYHNYDGFYRYLKIILLNLHDWGEIIYPYIKYHLLLS